MELLDYLRRMFRYDDWANREALAAIRAAQASEPPPEFAMKLQAHIAGAQRVWLHRIQRNPERVAVWPALSLDECERHLAELHTAWRQLLNAANEAQLNDRVSYVNSKGESWNSTLTDVLMHVAMHGAYHRGQIARELRRDGHMPAYTDFIEAARRGRI